MNSKKLKWKCQAKCQHQCKNEEECLKKSHQDKNEKELLKELNQFETKWKCQHQCENIRECKEKWKCSHENEPKCTEVGDANIVRHVKTLVKTGGTKKTNGTVIMQKNVRLIGSV